MKSVTMIPIAHIENNYREKFGVPRQSSLAPSVRSVLVMEEAFRNPDAFRGIEQYSHLWLLWGFSENPAAAAEDYSPTVRPPKLGGNVRMGVFATRSPFRPNPIGLSCVKLEEVHTDDPAGRYLIVSGTDLMNDTPVYDIKPYIPYADARPEALGGFAEKLAGARLPVAFSAQAAAVLREAERKELEEILSLDPRPGYQDDPERIYGLRYGAYDVHFTIKGGSVTVHDASLSESI